MVANTAGHERDGIYRKFGRASDAVKNADVKLNDGAKQIMCLQRQRQTLVAFGNGYGPPGTDHGTTWSHVAEPDRTINTPKLLKRIT